LQIYYCLQLFACLHAFQKEKHMKLHCAALATALLTFFLTTAIAQDFITNGLVAYYPFNGNANDAEGTNNGTIHGGVVLAPDRFGSNNSAYTFNGVDGYIDVGNPAGNTPTNFTASAWVKIISRATTGIIPEDIIITKRQTPFIGSGWPDLVVESTAPNAGAGEIMTEADNYVAQYRGTSHTQTNVWLFICEVSSNNTYQIYVNGVLENTATDSFPLSSVENMYLMHGGALGTYCHGVLDDVRIYNRALSSNEVAQIYTLEGGGTPVITAQPTNVIVNVGDAASFSVSATSSNQLTYQWFKDGVRLPNATNATLILPNVQPPRIGNYAAVIHGLGGSITSSVASLSISNVNSGLWQGLVAYYPFNGNANDAEGANNGTIHGGVVLAPDRFGSNNSAYTFNGVDGYIDIGNPVGNSPSNLTETAWVKIISRETSGIVSEDVIITKRQTPFIGSGWPDLVVESAAPNAGAGEIIVDADNYGAQYLGTSHTQTNVWFFICEVKSNNTYQIYVNGALENTVTDSQPLSSVENMYLMHHGAWGTYCHGLLDDVRIYNRALSSNEVTQIYASEAPSHAATAIATLFGTFVVSNSITDGGAGYTNTPLVRFIGGGGSGATAVAMVSNGVIVAINMISAGSGYTNAPLIVIDPPFIFNPVLGIAPISLLTFSNLTIGSSYQLQQFQSWYWTNQPVNFTASSAVYTQTVSGAAGAGEYRLALNPVPVQAFAAPQVVNGFVVGATITAGGSGYVTTPAVNINGDVGTNATAIVDGMSGGAVTHISITNPGSGYTNQVTVQIDPPPAVALSPTISPGVSLNSSSLAPYDNYQIQFESDLTGTWGNLNGGLFSPTAQTNSQYIFITNGAGFFRLQYLP
jgi:Concanavalin A-like lectin/glucanases superfamily/Immunoglobulin domain